MQPLVKFYSGVSVLSNSNQLTILNSNPALSNSMLNSLFYLKHETYINYFQARTSSSKFRKQFTPSSRCARMFKNTPQDCRVILAVALERDITCTTSRQ